MNNVFRWATALIFGSVIAYVMWEKEDVSNSVSEKPLQRKYGTIISPDLLMEFLLFLFIVVALRFSVRFSFDSLFKLLCGIFISIALFFALFILLLPVLRKYVSAKAIALMWLLPNYLYITVQNYMTLEKPRFVIDIGAISMHYVSLVWISVASVIFSVYIIRHFIFRIKLLRHAKPVESDLVRSLWETMQTAYEFKKPCIKIVTSENTATPLSIGLFRHTTVLVLPHTDYAEEELKLIFKHELIHIIRSDSQIKLFIAFCNAICWFNPLMWIAMKKCTEDLELSCDEYVLEDCSKEDKDLYGNLILATAGNEAGFTTCLSASAGALKYRLTNIYKPKRKFEGSLIVGVLMAVMLLTSGNIALSYNHQTALDVFNRNVKDLSIVKNSLSLEEGNTLRAYSCDDPERLNDYIMSLNVCEVTGNYYNMNNNDKCFYCRYQTDKGAVLVYIDDNKLKYSPLYRDERAAHSYRLAADQIYYLDESVDWDYLMSMMQFTP